MNHLMIHMMRSLINILIKLLRILPFMMIEKNKGKNELRSKKNRDEGNEHLWNDYFSETPTYLDNIFRRRFRMSKPLFMHIVDRLSNEVEFFRQKKRLSRKA